MRNVLFIREKQEKDIENTNILSYDLEKTRERKLEQMR